MTRKKVEKTLNSIPKSVATKYPPLTSEIQLKRTVKEQNALNRARSKAMENRVAKVLGGRRVLMSGAAAAYKGDVEVRFDNYPSGYIVECKLSAQSKKSEPYISLVFKWFPKMQEEAKNMGSKFSVLIVNFLGNTRDYVFVRRDVVMQVIKRYKSPLGAQLNKLLEESQLFDIRTNKSGKDVKSYSLRRSVLEAGMTKVDDIAGVRYLVPDGEYLVLHIDVWAKATEHM
jgi:hypothetical protein